MRSPHTAMKSSPRSPQLKKARAQQRRPNAAKNKLINKLILKIKRKQRPIFPESKPIHTYILFCIFSFFNFLLWVVSKIKIAKQYYGSSKNINVELPRELAIPFLDIYPKELKAGLRYLHISVCSSIIYNSQKVETAQMSVDGWMDKQTTVNTVDT